MSPEITGCVGHSTLHVYRGLVSGLSLANPGTREHIFRCRWWWCFLPKFLVLNFFVGCVFVFITAFRIIPWIAKSSKRSTITVVKSSGWLDYDTLKYFSRPFPRWVSEMDKIVI